MLERRAFLATLVTATSAAAGCRSGGSAASSSSLPGEVASADASPGGPGLIPTANPKDGGLSAAELNVAQRAVGANFTTSELEQMLSVVAGQAQRAKLATDVFSSQLQPALVFDPRLADWTPPPALPGAAIDTIEASSGGGREIFTYQSVMQLASALRAGKTTSKALTQYALARLDKFGNKLNCTVHLLHERAMAKAEQCDRELASGHDRGPLHGIPWGAKDIIAVAGAPTTWGAKPYEQQVFSQDAAVVTKLDQAGAVLVAKLSVGALAYGDVCLGKLTRNPWATEEGSSGSSAGSACAVAAGLLPFALGSETLGSIMSPAERCGVVGLRPTFGKVSRTGVMALAWSLDKIGPLARRVDDVMAILRAIEGHDASDYGSIDYGSTPGIRGIELPALRVGYDPSAFEKATTSQKAAIEVLHELVVQAGGSWQSVSPPALPYELLYGELMAESAAAFDQLTRSGQDDLMIGQDEQSWPNLFRAARFISAVDVVRSQQLRRHLMIKMSAVFVDYDCLVVPPTSDPWLTATNYTGHPAIALPVGMTSRKLRSLFDEPLPNSPLIQAPSCLSLIGGLHDEARICLLARELEKRLDLRLEPPGFA